MRRNSVLTFLKEKSFIIVLTLMLVSAGTMAALFTVGENKVAEEGTQQEQAKQPEKSLSETLEMAENGKTADSKPQTTPAKRTTTDTKENKVRDTASIQESAVVEAELEDQFLNTEDMEAASAADVVAEGFSEKKLLSLQWPVQGDVILPFSMDKSIYFKTLAQYQYNPAMLISASEGTGVAACAAGTVTEVGKNNEYGHYVTMDLGDGFMITYGQLFDITVEAGETVKKGEEFAMVAYPTGIYLEEGENLYLHLTQNGVSVDPELYLEK